MHFFIYYSNCTLPDCWCSSDGTLVPGGLSPTDVPQMVTITFDDAINDENWRLYSSRLFPQTRKNPNGCPVNIVSLFSTSSKKITLYDNTLYNKTLYNDILDTCNVLRVPRIH